MRLFTNSCLSDELMPQVTSVLVRFAQSNLSFSKFIEHFVKQAIAEQDQDQSFEATDESFEYKNHIHSTGNHFIQIAGQIYSRRNQQTVMRPKLLKSLQSDVVNDPLMVPAKVVRRRTVSKDKSLMNDDNLVGHQAGMGTAKFMKSKTHVQNNQAHAYSSAGVPGETSHRAIFDSLFRAEMTQIDAGNETQALIEETLNAVIVPKVILKRKAAWSGIVGNRDHQALSSNLADGNSNEQNTEVGANLQESPVTYSETVRLQFQLPRFVLFVCSVCCIILRSEITPLQEPYKRNFKTNQRR